MNKAIKIGSVSIPLDSYVISGTAILGTKESGKSYTAKGVAEQLLEHKIPIIVFDAIGVWRYLKIAGAGKGGKGFKVVVAGGKEPDLPLTPESAPEIVRAAIRENIPLIIDLYSKELSKADWRLIVQRCFRTLLYENEGLRHIFLEETPEYAPQKVDDGKTFAEVEKLVRMGGNASLGITLIAQRAQEVNKSILDLCENMVLMRQRGSKAIESLEKWMDRLAPDQAREVSKSMPHMGQGDAWIFTGAAEAPVRTRSGLIHSFHPDRRKPQLSAKATAAHAADTTEFVTRLTGELQTVLAQAAADDPKALRKQIADLQRQVNVLPVAAPAVDHKALEAAHQQGFTDGVAAQSKAWFQSTAKHMELLRHWLEQHEKGINDELAGKNPLGSGFKPGQPVNRRPQPAATITTTAVAGKDRREVFVPGRRMSPPAGTSSNKATASKGARGAQRNLLIALAQNPEGLRPRKLAILASVQEGGSTWRAAFARFRRDALIDESSGLVRITRDGQIELGEYELLPTGAALRLHWRAHLGDGDVRIGIYDAVLEAYPNAISSEEVARIVGVEHGGSTWRAHMAKLRGLELISGSKELQASEDLF